MPRFTPKRRASFLWTTVAVVVLIILALILVALATTLVVSRAADPHIVSDRQNAPSATVAIVLGALVYTDGTPSPMLRDRLATGVALYKAGKVKKLLLSGDHGTTTYDELEVMLEYCEGQGVPDRDIFTDHAGFDTYATMYRARDVFKVSDCLVVTQGFHLPRAVYIARALGLSATGVPADIERYPNEWRFALREWAARVKAVWQVQVTHPTPQYLGPTIPIDGDGRASRG